MKNIIKIIGILIIIISCKSNNKIIENKSYKNKNDTLGIIKIEIEKDNRKIKKDSFKIKYYGKSEKKRMFIKQIVNQVNSNYKIIIKYVKI